MALTPYSVSPRRTDHKRGPKPTKYSVTFIRLHLAVAKWPSSWTMTITMMATMTISSALRPAAKKRATTAAITTASRTNAHHPDPVVASPAGEPGVGGGPGSVGGTPPSWFGPSSPGPSSIGLPSTGRPPPPADGR